jgi:hypothetical protein
MHHQFFGESFKPNLADQVLAIHVPGAGYLKRIVV